MHCQLVLKIKYRHNHNSAILETLKCNLHVQGMHAMKNTNTGQWSIMIQHARACHRSCHTCLTLNYMLLATYQHRHPPYSVLLQHGTTCIPSYHACLKYA